MDQFLISMPPVLILVRNACSYLVCMHSAVVIRLRILLAKESLVSSKAGTTEAIFVVRQLQEKYLVAIKRLYMVFVDLEKYFTSPGHPADIGLQLG